MLGWMSVASARHPDPASSYAGSSRTLVLPLGPNPDPDPLAITLVADVDTLERALLARMAGKGQVDRLQAGAAPPRQTVVRRQIGPGSRRDARCGDQQSTVDRGRWWRSCRRLRRQSLRHGWLDLAWTRIALARGRYWRRQRRSGR